MRTAVWSDSPTPRSTVSSDGNIEKEVADVEDVALDPTDRQRGVMVREVVNYSSFWRSSTFSSTVDPTIYLLAFGFGFGSLVSTVAGYDYIDFVGTGIVATTSSDRVSRIEMSFEPSFDTYAKLLAGGAPGACAQAHNAERATNAKQRIISGAYTGRR